MPAPPQVGEYLDERTALLLLDDCEVERDDLATLLDSAPRCTFVVASAERTLWDRGTARALGGLDPEAASSLLERKLGRPIEAKERPAAEAVIKGLDGRPQSLVEVAALLADGRVSLSELAAEPTALAESRDLEALSDSQRRILELLATLAGAPLGVEHVAAVASTPRPSASSQSSTAATSSRARVRATGCSAEYPRG